MNTTTLAPVDKGATLTLAGKRRLREATNTTRHRIGIAASENLADDPGHIRFAIAELLSRLGLQIGGQR